MPTPSHRHIAPRLWSKQKRIANAHAIPEHVKRALQMIAVARGESVSWVLEQVIYAHFDLRPPRYVGLRHADLDISKPATVKYPRSA